MLKNIFNYFKGESEEEIRNRVLKIADDVDCGIYSPPMKAKYALNELCYHLMGAHYYYTNYASNYPRLKLTRENKNAILLYDIETNYRRYKPKNKIFKYVKESQKAIIDRINSLSSDPKYEYLYMHSVTDQKAINEICDHLLGEDWYVVDPLTTEQVNTIIVYEIEMEYKRVKY